MLDAPLEGLVTLLSAAAAVTSSTPHSMTAHCLLHRQAPLWEPLSEVRPLQEAGSRMETARTHSFCVPDSPGVPASSIR